MEKPLGDGFFAISAKNMRKINALRKIISKKKSVINIPASECIINTLYSIGPCKRVTLLEKLLDDLIPCRCSAAVLLDLQNRGRVVKTDKLYNLSDIERVRLYIEKQPSAVTIRELQAAGLKDVENALTVLCKMKKVRQTLENKFEIAVCRQKISGGSKKKSNINL